MSQSLQKRESTLSWSPWIHIIHERAGGSSCVQGGVAQAPKDIAAFTHELVTFSNQAMVIHSRHQEHKDKLDVFIGRWFQGFGPRWRVTIAIPLPSSTQSKQNECQNRHW